MSVIRILDEDVANRIAAGEVVERPASIVKELVENSLDAGASRITIQVERGGQSLIRVLDDGCGMDSEDALLCLEAHATSKIRDSEDIEAIGTFGFRGEAIPSIAAVSRMQLVSRPAAGDSGTDVLVHGGVIQHSKPTGCAPGTTITVRNLFFNTPARRKFLRSPQTEEAHIQETVLLLALANPRVAFELSFDQRAVLQVPGQTDLATRASLLIGRAMVAEMTAVDHASDDIRVWGLAAKPGLTRSSRRDQRVFVNGRAVDAQTIYNGIREAYHTLVGKGRYPPVLLFVELDPRAVDVNVHPAKREVRFRQPRQVGVAVTAALTVALRGMGLGDLPLPALGGRGKAPALPPAPLPPAQPPPATVENAAELPRAEPPPEPTDAPRPPPAAPSASPIPPPTPAPRPPPANEAPSGRDALRHLRVLGAVGERYLVAEGPGGVVLIDPRAAHERVIFERLLAARGQRRDPSQGLLIPVTIDFAAADADVLRRHLEAITELGFDLQDFGGDTFVLNAVPLHFPQENLAGLLRDLVDDLRDRPGGVRQRAEQRVAESACRAAVRAAGQLRPEEIAALLAELAGTEMPYTCPHGQPTLVNLAWSEIDKRFGKRE